MKGIAIFLSSLSVLISIISTQTACVSTVENDGPLQKADNDLNSSEPQDSDDPLVLSKNISTVEDSPTSETVVDTPQADERAMVAPPTSETAMDTPLTPETVVDAPQADERAMVASPTSETAMDTPPTPETVVDPTLATERAMDASPTSEISMDTLSTSETIMDTPPTPGTVTDATPASETTMNAPPISETVVDASPTSETTMDTPLTPGTVTDATPASETTMNAPPISETVVDAPPTSETTMDTPLTAVKHDSSDFSPTLEGWGWVFRSDLSTPGNWRFLNRERAGNSTKFNFNFDDEGTWSFVFDQQNLSEGGRRREIRKLKYSKDLGVEIIDSGELNSPVPETEEYTDIQDDPEPVPKESVAVDSRTTEALIQEAIKNGSAGEIASLLPRYMENEVDPEVLDSVVNILDDAAGYEEEVFNALISLSQFSSHQKNAEWLFRLASFLAKPGEKRSLSQAVVFYQKVIDSWPLSRWRELAEERLIWLKRHYFRSQ